MTSANPATTESPGFTLWFRPTRRHKWRAVGTAADRCGALGLMETSGERNGEWLIREAGDPPERAEEAK